MIWSCSDGPTERGNSTKGEPANRATRTVRWAARGWVDGSTATKGSLSTVLKLSSASSVGGVAQ